MKLEGIYTPVITPFNDDYSVNEKALAEVIEHQITLGVHGVIVSGTTGESYALTQEERVRCFHLGKEVIRRRVPFIAGIGATRTEDVIELGVAARDAGADAILLPAPAYAVPTQEELAQHCLAVDRAVNLPIILYNYPGRTGAMMGSDFLDYLSGNTNFCAIKETSGNVNRLHLLASEYGHMQLSCGWDDQALEFFAWGARSWVGGAANCLLTEHIALYRACVVENDLDKGRKIMAALLPFFQLLDDSGKYIQCVKHGCVLEGLATGPVRRPLQPMTPELQQKMDTIWQTCKSTMQQIQAAEENEGVNSTADETRIRGIG
ncbi:MAG: dihydrodipicolinate synthase family protein [Gammaproteobacteria bacterium]|nr:dihydrodipicolinate synthase family protein [Gammaproteobacteria bacterium]